MKALFFRQHGGLDKLEYGELSDPALKANEVLVRVNAAALNHLDLWVLGGWPGLKLEMPHVGGSDIAGTVEQCSSAVTGWKSGDRVVINPGVVTAQDEWSARGEESVSPNYQIIGEHRRGGFAELIAVPAENLLRLPDQIPFEEGAAPLLVGVTAWRMLKHRAALKSGEIVLIVGAGGGVNSFSTLLAKSLGALVIVVTRSTQKEKQAKALGADEVIAIDKHPEWSKEVYARTGKRGADVIIDNVGQATFGHSLRAAARGGRIVTVGNTSGFNVTFDNRLVFGKQLSLLGSTMGSAADFREVTSWIWEKKLKIPIDSVLPLSNGREGYAKMERGELFGKILLTP